MYGIFENISIFALTKNAQMAELVDALVSNTSGFTSMPVRSRLWVQEKPDNQLIVRLFDFQEGQNRDEDRGDIISLYIKLLFLEDCLHDNLYNNFVLLQESC